MENTEAYLLPRLTHGLENHSEYISRISQVVDVDFPSIEKGEVLVILPAKDEWINELTLYKTQGVTPNDFL